MKVIHNPYTDAVDGIKASEEFKRELTKKLLSQQAVSIQKPGKKKRFKRAWAFAIAAVLALTVAAGGIMWGNGIFLKSNTGIAVGGKNDVTGPHFYIGNRSYWPKEGCSVTKLPPNFKYIGKTARYGEGNIESCGVGVGNKIYMDPTASYAAYMDLIICKTGTKIHSSDIYVLYTTNEISEGSICINGKVYNFCNPPQSNPRHSVLIGTVKSVDVVRIPSHNFETNIKNTLGAEVYQEKTDKSVVYIKQKDGEITYFKLNFH